MWLIKVTSSVLLLRRPVKGTKNTKAVNVARKDDMVKMQKLLERQPPPPPPLEELLLGLLAGAGGGGGGGAGIGAGAWDGSGMYE